MERLKFLPLFVVVLFFSPLLMAEKNGDKIDQINKFFSIFSDQCSLVSSQTRDAKSIIDGLIDTVKTIESDPNCKSLSGMTNELNMISGQIQNLSYTYNDVDRQLLGYENKKRELFLLLSQSLSPAESQIIQTEIQTIQLSIAELRGQQNGYFENDSFQRRLRTSQSLISSTNAVFNRLSANENCWVNHPGLLQNVSGLGVAIGQSLAIGARSPETAMLAGMGLNLVSNIVDYFHRKKMESKLDPLISGIEATALTCAMEKMSVQYCNARDSEMAIQTVAQALTSQPQNDPVWSSLRLLERELPNITEWLEMVTAGTRPSSTPNARQRQEVYIKEEKMKSAMDFVYGLISERKKLIDSISDPQKKWIEIKSIVSEISYKISPPCCTTADQAIQNPLSKRFSRDNGSYYLLGFTNPPMATYSGTRTPITFESFDPFGTEHGSYRDPVLQVTPQTILENFKTWYRDTEDVLISEKSRIIIDDPLMVFARAYPKSISGQQKGLSPRHSFIKILEFLRSNQNTVFAAPSLQLILQDTTGRIEDVIKRIDAVMANKQTPEDALSSIWISAKLDKGTGFLRSRVEFFIKTILEEMILNSSSSDPKKIQLLAANDVIQYLKQFSGSQSLQKMMDDSKNAQSLTSAAMLQFLNTFGESIDKSMRYYDQLIRKFNENSSGAHTRSKTVLCLNLAAMPQSTTPVSFSSCLGLQMKSVFPGGPDSIAINSKTMTETFESRVCHYRDFHRRNAVFYSLLESGNTLPPIEQAIETTVLNPTPVKLNTYETPEISQSCQNSVAWKTDRNPYCEKDWWDGCDRQYANTCESIKKRNGLGRFFGF